MIRSRDKLRRLWSAARMGLAAIVAGLALAAVAPDAAMAQETAPAATAEITIAPVPVAAPEAPAEDAAVEAPAPTVDKGDTGWMLISTVLVLAMIIPGLALF